MPLTTVTLVRGSFHHVTFTVLLPRYSFELSISLNPENKRLQFTDPEVFLLPCRKYNHNII